MGKPATSRSRLTLDIQEDYNGRNGIVKLQWSGNL